MTDTTDRPARPVAPAPQWDAIPADLRGEPRWVLWRYQWRDGTPATDKKPATPGKWTKVPYCARTGKAASTTDEGTWAAFDVARAAFSRRKKWDGVGWVLAPGTVGFDLDHAGDPPAEWAAAILTDFAGTYAEWSPSHEGIHILAIGEKPGAACRREEVLPVEVYSGPGRFFTVTGIPVNGCPHELTACQPAIDRLYARLFGPVPEETRPPTAPVPPAAAPAPAARCEHDETIIDRALAKDEKLARLWSGDVTGYPSASEADAALAMKLAFYLDRDEPRVTAAMWRSAAVREKWQANRIYLARTVAGACQQVTTTRERHGKKKLKTEHGNPVLQVKGRPLGQIIERASGLLNAGNTPPVLFRRGEGLSRVQPNSEGRPTIRVVGEPEILLRLAEVADCVNSNGNDVLPPRDLLRALLASSWPGLPALSGLARAPVMRPDGTILRTPGYDAATGLVYVPDPTLRLPTIPDAPTAQDVAASLALLDDLIADFPFVEPADRAHALAFMLTIANRPAMDVAPLFVISAPTPRTGKGLLVDTLSIVALGAPAPMGALPGKEEEADKRILALLSAGEPLVVFDNQDDTVRSAALARALTATVYCGRTLGVSRMEAPPNLATWAITGNCIRLAGDLPPRAVWVRLDAHCPHPEHRSGFRHPRLKDYARDHRGELLAALLVLSRAWHAAGRPAPDPALRLGGFEPWLATVGGILGFVGVPGLSRQSAETRDEEADSWALFLRAIVMHLGRGPFAVAEVVECLALRETLPDGPAEALEARGPRAARTTLGIMLSAREGRPYELEGCRYTLRRGLPQHQAATWKVEVEGAES